MNHGQDAVSRVVVRLSGVNGQNGGEDKSCSIELRVTGNRTLIVSETQVDLYVAIDRASERIGRSLNRHLARRRVFHADSATRRQLPTEETR
jgi:ribosome-associated translation inhibitor RaiA